MNKKIMKTHHMPSLLSELLDVLDLQEDDENGFYVNRIEDIEGFNRWFRKHYSTLDSCVIVKPHPGFRKHVETIKNHGILWEDKS